MDHTTPDRPAIVEAELAGRGAELAMLRSSLGRALEGKRQVVFVSGEAGLGKTTLVSTFAEEVAGQGLSRVAHGLCLDYHGETEPYLPILDALGRLCRSDAAGECVDTLASVAPSWLLQLPWLLPPDRFAEVQARATGATRERMLREITEAIETICRSRPLVLVLEDMQWSDPATADVVSMLARRTEQTRLLLVCTVRPSALHDTHALRRVRDDLRIRGQCVEIVASQLGQDAIEQYLAQRLGRALATELAPLLQRRTGGNPLFLRTMLDAWVSDGRIRESTSGWQLAATIDELSRSIPESVRQQIALQLDALPEPVRNMLTAAAVAGGRFSAACVAAACRVTEDEVEEALEDLAVRGAFIVESQLVQHPDGSVSAGYAFVHDLVREVVYEGLTGGRRSRLHSAIGTCLERRYAMEAGNNAAELAHHFREGRDPGRAISYLLQAAQVAVSRSAQAEALDYIRPAIVLLHEYPAIAQRKELEIQAQAMFAVALMATEGFAGEQCEVALQRALGLAH
ncbi:MAG: AAA family ATPase, partial [Thermomicrobiales bacterium]|nr:AAA family ATPase [Thermomicrobiales bacterium]